MSEAQSLGLSLLSSIKNLKESGNPLIGYQATEFYLADSEFDVVVTIQLKPKLSQHEIGMRMFGERK